MASPPILTIVEESHVSPSSTVAERSLPLTFFDILWLVFPPVQTVIFYELQITKAQFIEDIIPKLKNSLSITLNQFLPFAGKLIVFPTPTKNPEIRYVEGDSVPVTFTECIGLDFKNLTGNHPRDCDQFHHLIPLLGPTGKVSDYITIPVVSIQLTLFPNNGFSIGMTNHHSLCDASTRFLFLKAWASIALSGNDLGTESLPCYDRLINYPELDETYLKYVKVNEEYRPPSHSGPFNKVRATVILTRNVLNRFKKLVSTKFPTLAYVSSFTVACAYIWSCIAKARNDEIEMFNFAVDCRARLDPPVPSTYFGNCAGGCFVKAKTIDITGMEGFLTAAKLFGENLHKMLNDKSGVIKDYMAMYIEFISVETPTTIIGIAGTPKFKFYELDFGWGKPKKYETISIDEGLSISLNASKESSDDLEIGLSLSTTEMETFLSAFNVGLETYI